MKSFLNAKTGEKVTVTRNDKSIALASIQQEKGSKGQFPGILLSDFNRETFIDWLPKNKEVEKQNRFNNFVVDCFNELSQLVWKTTVANHDIEYDPKTTKTKPEVVVTDEVYKSCVDSFITNLCDVLDGETRAIKVRDSKYYLTEFKNLTQAFTKETDAKKKAELRLQALQAKKTASELQAAEEKAIEALLFDLEVTEDTANEPATTNGAPSLPKA